MFPFASVPFCVPILDPHPFGHVQYGGSRPSVMLTQFGGCPWEQALSINVCSKGWSRSGGNWGGGQPPLTRQCVSPVDEPPCSLQGKQKNTTGPQGHFSRFDYSTRFTILTPQSGRSVTSCQHMLVEVFHPPWFTRQRLGWEKIGFLVSFHASARAGVVLMPPAEDALNFRC